MILAILGRQPKISLAELESVFGSKNVKPLSKQVARLDINVKNVNFDRFGSVIKFAEVIQSISSPSSSKVQRIVIDDINGKFPVDFAGKQKIGISSYGTKLSAQNIGKLALTIKKVLKGHGYSVRIIPNKSPALGSAAIIHNKLTSQNGTEILLVQDGGNMIVARTIHEQNIEAYAARDQARPKRDPRVGMLPPKLAQTILNLATGPADKGLVLDPFCGTGVLLQEALLMGFDVYGTDLEPRMIDYSQINLKWLKTNHPTVAGKVKLDVGDACIYKWQPIPQFIAAETYLGRPLTAILPQGELVQLAQSVNTLHKKFLANLAKQVPSGTRICLGVPSWRTKKGFYSLPVLDQLPKIGYNQLVFSHAMASDLIYARADQIVARQLVVLQTK